jgi:hypothetical protein
MMIIDLSDFKTKRPKITPLYEYLEEMYADNGETTCYRDNIPYPDNVKRFFRLMPPVVFYPVKSEKFVKLLTWMSDWVESLHESYPTQSFLNAIANAFPELHEVVTEKLGVDFHTFITCRMIECVHLVHQGPTVHYHPDLFNMLSVTDVKKSCDVPISVLKVPYTSVYLDWRDCPNDLGNADGDVYQGCYVQSTVMKYEDAVSTGILESDITLKQSVKKGLIRKDKDLFFFNMEFVSKCTDPEKIENLLFSIACSIDNDILLKDAMFSEEEVAIYNSGGTSFKTMENPIGMVISTLMYMNTKDSVREEIKEASGMTMQIKQMKNPSKKRKAAARLARSVFDYVRIGKRFKLDGLFDITKGDSSKKSAHIRLGYFNQYYVGNKLARDEAGEVIRDKEGNGIAIPKEEREIEIKWIMPTLVNANSRVELDKVKNRKLY